MPWPKSVRDDVRARGYTIAYQATGPLVDSTDYEQPPSTVWESTQNAQFPFVRALVDKFYWMWSNRYNYLGAPNTRPNLLATAMLTWPGKYQGNMAYLPGATLFVNGAFYRAPAAYTSALNGNFAADFAAGKWTAATAWVPNATHTLNKYYTFFGTVFRCSATHVSGSDFFANLDKFALVQNTALRPSRPLPYQAGSLYYATEVATNVADNTWWRRSFDGSAGASIAADNAADPAGFTGSIVADVLTVSSVASGLLKVNQTISGNGVTPCIIAAQISGATGGVGVYALMPLEVQQNVASQSLSAVTLNWIPLAQVIANVPTARVEYTSHSKANWSVAIPIALMCGMSFSEGQTLATAAGLTMYTWAQAEDQRDDIFCNRSLDLAALGARAYANARDAIILPPYRFTDMATAWTPNSTFNFGQMAYCTEFTPPRIYQCLVNNRLTSGTTFANELLVNPQLWRRARIGLLLDHEISDRRPDIASNPLDTTPNKDGNLEWLMRKIKLYMQAAGFSWTLYTNDIDPLNGVATNNAITEDSIDIVLECADCFAAITDGDNYRGNSFEANLIANHRRMAYPNSDPSKPYRPHYDPSKVGVSLELLGTYGYRCFPITGVSVNPDTKAITILAPNHNFVGNTYVCLRGIYGIPELTGDGIYKVGGGSLTGVSFMITKKVKSVDRKTLLPIETSFTGDNLTGAYVGGGMVMTGGNGYVEFVRAVEYLKSKGVRYYDIWRGFSTFDQRQFAPIRSKITNITKGNPAVVTTDRPHGLGSGDGLRAWIDGIEGDLGKYLNRIAYDVTKIDNTTFSLSSNPAAASTALIVSTNATTFDTSSLPAYTSGGTCVSARVRMTAQKLMALSTDGYHARHARAVTRLLPR